MALKDSGPDHSKPEWQGAIAWHMWCPACGLQSPAILGLLMPPRSSALEQPVTILRSTCAKDHLTEALLNVSVFHVAGHPLEVGLAPDAFASPLRSKAAGTESRIHQAKAQTPDGYSNNKIKTTLFWSVWVMTWLYSWARSVTGKLH